jgi:hypothetical protein
VSSNSALKKPTAGASKGNGNSASSAQKDGDVSDAPKTSKKLEAVDKLAKGTELYIAIGLVIFFAGIYAAGYRYWDERYYIPEEGLGYFMGLVGGLIMLFAMLYSLFKKFPSLRNKIDIKGWLNIHIAMGIIGPLLIYFHSSFHIGSLNGGIALISMSLVLLSGIIGRFLYSKTHFGLGGRKAKLGELHKMLNDENSHIHSPRLNLFTKKVMSHSSSLIQASWELVSYGIRRRWVYLRVKHEMLEKLKQHSASNNLNSKEFRAQKNKLKRHVRIYLLLLQKVALFKLYERFFAFWRHAHVPLIYLLLISGIVHVIAVHMY